VLGLDGFPLSSEVLARSLEIEVRLTRRELVTLALLYDLFSVKAIVERVTVSSIAFSTQELVGTALA